MPNLLTNLKITEVAFCKKGMNPNARIALFKEETDEPLQNQWENFKAASEAPPQAAHEFERLVNSIIQNDGVSRSVAMTRARRTNPTSFMAYQAAGTTSSRPPIRKIEPEPTAVTKFIALVQQMQQARGCSHHEAMSIVRKEYPDEFAEFQNV